MKHIKKVLLIFFILTLSAFVIGFDYNTPLSVNQQFFTGNQTIINQDINFTYSNYFNQFLNTTNNVFFNSINTTTGQVCTVGNGLCATGTTSGSNDTLLIANECLEATCETFLNVESRY